ncbi:MAG: hypothetical protein M1812_006614 [Candelaria pacifica]|nr:MAG: hypothetical protein M1812_006614 [Candelaria pacifica]
MSPAQVKAGRAKLILEMWEELMKLSPAEQAMMLKDVKAVMSRYDSRQKNQQAKMEKVKARKERKIQLEEAKAENEREEKEAAAKAAIDNDEEGSADKKTKKSRKGHRSGKKVKKAALNEAHNEYIALKEEDTKELEAVKAEIETSMGEPTFEMIERLARLRLEVKLIEEEAMAGSATSADGH